jgi:tetratricopeptide (TPR) repeat protein
MCQENWRDAAATLERAIAVKSDFAQAHYNLGSVRIRLGDSEKAIESFREAARCNPGDAAAFAALAEAQEVAGKRQEAMESADRALQLDRGNARALGVKARISGSSH